jgi:hypothetical protein
LIDYFIKFSEQYFRYVHHDILPLCCSVIHYLYQVNELDFFVTKSCLSIENNNIKNRNQDFYIEHWQRSCDYGRLDWKLTSQCEHLLQNRYPYACHLYFTTTVIWEDAVCQQYVTKKKNCFHFQFGRIVSIYLYIHSIKFDRPREILNMLQFVIFVFFRKRYANQLNFDNRSRLGKITKMSWPHVLKCGCLTSRATCLLVTCVWEQSD